jgi:hypothetical protein
MKHKGVLFDTGATPMIANIFYQRNGAKRIHTIYFSVFSVQATLVAATAGCTVPPCEALKSPKQSKFAHSGGINYPKLPILA